MTAAVLVEREDGIHVFLREDEDDEMRQVAVTSGPLNDLFLLEAFA